MNIALGGLILFLLIIPGAVFRLFLIKSESFENPLDTSRLAEVTFVLIPSLILHYFGYQFLSQKFELNIRLDQFYYLIAGDSTGGNLDFEYVINNSFQSFFKYLGFLTLIAAILGYFLKSIILFFYLDLRYNVFAITNEWDNLLSSREFIFDLKKQMWRDYKLYIIRYLNEDMSFKRLFIYTKLYYLYYKNLSIDFIQIDLLVKTTNSDIIYQGTLKKYFLSKGNNLDKIYLERIFKKEHNVSASNNFEQIESDILVFKGDEVININVTYLYLEN